jgi:NAD(P)-dependent dehydrogenase (short-subunit alcohol dehydrogenase family)
MRTVALTGSASGIGAATATRLREAGNRVIGVDVQDGEVSADLSTPTGRRVAIDGILEECGGVLDGLVTCAGVGGLPGRAGSRVVEVNYFGSIELIEGLQGALASGASPSVVAIVSNSVTIQPGIPLDVVEACLSGDRERARQLADEKGGVSTYPATKLAVSRWVRRHAPGESWIGSGIRVNAVSPGMVDTALVEEQRRDPEMAVLLEVFPVPVGRPGRPEEIATLIEFLLGEQSTFLCGSIVLADGGSEALLRPDDWPSPWRPLPEGSDLLG